jgi:hypothetical protein
VHDPPASEQDLPFVRPALPAAAGLRGELSRGSGLRGLVLGAWCGRCVDVQPCCCHDAHTYQNACPPRCTLALLQVRCSILAPWASPALVRERDSWWGWLRPAFVRPSPHAPSLLPTHPPSPVHLHHTHSLHQPSRPLYGPYNSQGNLSRDRQSPSVPTNTVSHQQVPLASQPGCPPVDLHELMPHPEELQAHYSNVQVGWCLVCLWCRGVVPWCGVVVWCCVQGGRLVRRQAAKHTVLLASRQQHCTRQTTHPCMA